MNRRDSEAAQRFADRRRREDEAPRLHAAVPTLESLKLSFREKRAGGQLADVAHVRQIVVDRAPALFEFPCQDTSCKEGGHDLTQEILRSLRASAERFEGEDVCHGQLGTAVCGRVLNFVGTATYRA